MRRTCFGILEWEASAGAAMTIGVAAIVMTTMAKQVRRSRGGIRVLFIMPMLILGSPCKELECAA
jgi:hypothetical protein